MSSDKYLKILELIESFSKGNFDSRITISESNSDLDSIALRLNKLGEQLSFSNTELEPKQFNFGNILNKFPADIVVFDTKHNYLFVNELAVSDEETRKWLIGKNDFEYCELKGIDDKIAYKRRLLFNEAILTKSDVEWIDEHRSIDDKAKYILRKFHPVFENNKLKYVIGYGIDVTALKNAEKEKTKLIEELNHKNNDMMQFNYIISHNLRGPVASIMGLSDLMNMPTISEEEKTNTIDHIRSSALKMDELLKDLSILLSSSSTLNNQKENIDIAAVIKSVTDTFETQIIHSNIIVKTSITEEAKIISSIKSYFESILYNLISNAIKYISPKRKPEILITTIKKGDNMIMTVEDNGIGIDLTKYGQSVFGLYKRFNVETDGKGLGLHMTKTQVETLGGAISIESELDKGTKFTVILPMT
jgi:signal transduction histidine kinase